MPFLLRTGAGAALAALAFAPSVRADPLQDQVLAGIRRSDTGDIAFTQTMVIERTGAAAQTIVTHYDPRAAAAQRWSVTRIDGRAPTAKEAAPIVKAARGRPTPAYARLGLWFGGAATRVAQAPGSVTYRFARLPAGVLKLGSHDAGADTVADAMVNTAGPTPYVERIRFASTKPFRMMLLAKIEQLVIGSAYAPMADGRLFPVAADSAMSGSMMGKNGSLRTHTRYAEVHPSR